MSQQLCWDGPEPVKQLTTGSWVLALSFLVLWHAPGRVTGLFSHFQGSCARVLRIPWLGLYESYSSRGEAQTGRLRRATAHKHGKPHPHTRSVSRAQNPRVWAFWRPLALCSRRTHAQSSPTPRASSTTA